MRIENLRYIVEVSKYKSMNKASKNLYINQQQLSRIISQTEECFNITIFERTAKGSVLTDKGKETIRKFEEILDIYDSIIPQKHTSLAQNLHGKIKILSDINIWSAYVDVYKEFIKKYSSISVHTECMPSEKIVKFLQENEGIGQISRIIYEDKDDDFLLPSDISYRNVSGKQHVSVYANKNNPYIGKYKTISLETLLELPLVNYKPYDSTEKTIMERIFKPIGKPNIKYEVHSYRVFREIVRDMDCFFVTMRKPSYIIDEDLIEIPLRNKVYLESGLVRNKNSKNDLYDIFEDFYLNRYYKLYMD